MRRKAQATEFRYSPLGPRHHGGPVERLQKQDKCSFTARVWVNEKRFNAMDLNRRLRLAKEDARLAMPPRLIRHAQFKNTPHS
jgi:hypothetical protein